MRFRSSAPSPVKPLALETPPTPPPHAHTLRRDPASRETRPGRKEAPPPAPLSEPSTRTSLAQRHCPPAPGHAAAYGGPTYLGLWTSRPILGNHRPAGLRPHVGPEVEERTPGSLPEYLPPTPAPASDFTPSFRPTALSLRFPHPGASPSAPGLCWGSAMGSWVAGVRADQEQRVARELLIRPFPVRQP